MPLADRIVASRGRAWWIVALHLAVAAACATGLSRLRQTDDLLDFVPSGDADVRAFREVSQTFGSLQVAVVGVEAPPGDDVFSTEMLERVGAASRAYRSITGVDRVVSLTTLPDFTSTEGATETHDLVDVARLPRTAEARAALKARVMARGHVVGSFVARDARATVILVFLVPGGPSRSIANQIRAATSASFGGYRAVYGGAPFAAAAIYEETTADQRKLIPIALLLILAVIVVAFRDWLGVLLTLACIGWSSIVVLGIMGLVGEPFTLISATLPIILFASGSSYAVHLLGRYYSDGGGDGQAVARAAGVVTAPLLIAAGTTSAGFLSYLVMDIRPMRSFGVECAGGVLLCLLSSLTLVPAVIRLAPRRGSTAPSTGRLGDKLAALSSWARRRRALVLATAALLGAATVVPMLHIDVRMEPRSFFAEGSEPWEAERFLDERFGGSQFIQIEVGGDMTDPATLYEVARLEDFARALPGVTQVEAVTGPLAMVNEAMGGGRRLPETAAQARSLLPLVEGEPSLRSVLAPGRDRALVHIRVRGFVQSTMEALDVFVHQGLSLRPAAPDAARAAERLGWIARAAGAALDEPAARRSAEAVRAPSWPTLAPAARADLAQILDGDGGFLDAIPAADPRRAAAFAAFARGELDGRAALVALAPSPREGEQAWAALRERVHLRAREAALAPALALLPPLPPPSVDAAREALGELVPLDSIAPASRALAVRLAGEPVLDRGFSRSIARNQVRSLEVSLLAVALLMLALFRSPRLALIAVIPSTLATAVVFGAMGLRHTRIDLSTSLVASIAMGAGSDFAMHYLWYLRRFSAREVVRFVGPVMVLSTLLVAASFAVLALGRSQPMRLFGSLAALSLALAAAFTFLLVPALLRTVGAREESDALRDDAAAASSVADGEGSDR